MRSILYSIPYIFVAGLLFLFYLNEKRILKFLSTKGAIYLAWFVVFVFIGLRGHVYSDFISYYPFFEDLPNIFSLNLDDYELVEPGFVIYSSLIKTIAPNYFIWVAINTFLDLLVFNWVFKRYTASQILPLLFFLAFQGLIIEFNLYRNVKAMDLFLLSIPFLQQRRILPYMALNILGVVFHSSALLYIPLYFIIHKQIPKLLIYGGIIASNILYLGHISFIGDLINGIGFIQDLTLYDKLVRYQDMDVEYGFTIGYIERTCSILIFTYFYDKLIVQNRCNIIFYNCFFIYYNAILIFNEVLVFVERIPLLFIFAYWILYPNVLALKIKQHKLITALSSLFVISKIALASNGMSYENILWNHSDYNTRAAQAEEYMDNN